MRLQLSQTHPDWMIRVVFPEKSFNQWRVNGPVILPQTENHMHWVEVNGKEITLELIRPE